jgi:hypothetical protein
VNARVLTPALNEIVEAALWFDLQRVGLGDEFWQAVDLLLVRIEKNPLSFSKSDFATSDSDIRLAFVWRFDYVVHFLVEMDEVKIISVAHASRRPGYWLSRIKKS